MKIKLFAAAVFSLLTFLIPLTALTKKPPEAVSTTVNQNISSSSSSSSEVTSEENSAETSESASENSEESTSSESSSSQSADENSAQETTSDNPSYTFRDYFMILDNSSGKVEKMSLRDYLLGAVCAEMPADFAEEALKAQAVAAHTYALRLSVEQSSSPSEELNGADFSADPSNWLGYTTKELAKERFGNNFDVYWSKIEKAVDSVLNEIIVYENTPIAAVYHSMSSGMTEDAQNVWQSSVPYLVATESQGDTLAENFDSTVTLSGDEVKAKISAFDSSLTFDDDPNKWFSNAVVSDSGYIVSIDVCGKTVSGTQFRNMFSLRSACVHTAFSNGSFTFSVKGYGHGVGMSQYGADYMARQGSTYRDILDHYYPNCQIIRVKSE